MKRISAVLSLVMILVLAMAQCAFASGLEVTNVSPSDGETGKQISNMAVKYTFSQPMGDDAAEKNKDKFKITDEDGNSLAYSVVSSEDKYPNQLWLIIEGELTSNKTYTIEVLPGIVSASGEKTTESFTNSFKTRNTKTDSYISMGMMAIFMFVMMRMTTKMAQDQQEAAKPENSNEPGQNPYKMAKEKNISVAEATKLIDADKEKSQKKGAKHKEKDEKRKAEFEAAVKAAEERLLAEAEAARKALNYRVHKAGSVKAHGLEVPRVVIKHNKAKRKNQQKKNK